ncbi:MAG: hypothetical protein KJN63_08555 [Acidimicrobiia bacterium]|nr:hypothetical protein [Acidimicrobiia bacterium]
MRSTIFKRTVLLVGGSMLLAACGGATTGATTSTMAVDSSTTTAGRSSTTVTTLGPGPAGDELDVVTYVAAIEDTLAGTKYEGEALEAPDVFLATGGLFCEQLDAGMPPDGIVAGYVEALISGSIERATDDELTMAGGVLGVGVVMLCPRHLDLVTGSR